MRYRYNYLHKTGFCVIADLLLALLQHCRYQLQACDHVYNTVRLLFGMVLYRHLCQLLRVFIVNGHGEHATIALASITTLPRYLTADALTIAARAMDERICVHGFDLGASATTFLNV